MEIVNNLTDSRFETIVEGLLCVADYRREGTRLVMPHTHVPTVLRGRGIAAALVQTALDWARAEGLQVVPQCAYVATYMRRHPPTHALSADD